MTAAPRAAFAALAALAALGCTGETAPPPPRENAEAPEPGRPVTSLAEIEGPWDIVRFDGYEPARLESSGTRRAYVQVGDDRLSYVIECNYSGNPARIDATGILLDTGDGTRLQTMMGCGAEGEARESAFFAFFGTRPKVAWIGDGQLRLSNGRRELILERPEARRLAHVPPPGEIERRWLPRMATRLIGDEGHEGWGFQEPAVLTIDAGRIAYSGCGGFSHPYRYEEGGRLVTGERQGEARCADNPGSLLAQLLEGDPLVERMAGGIALQSGRLVVTLQSEEELRRLRDSPPPPLDAAPPPPPPPPPTRQPDRNR